MSTENDTRQRVFEETSAVLSRSVVLLGSKGVTWGLAFLMTILLPRYLGPTAYGQLYFAISFTAIFSILVEFGLNSLVVREVSRKRGDATRYLLNAALIKGGLWVVAYGAMIAIVESVGYTPQARTSALILGAGVLVTSMATLLVAVLQANDRARWVAASTVTEKLVYVILGVVLLLLGYGVVAVALVMLVGSVCGFLLDVYWFRRLARTHDTHEGWRGIEVRGLFRRAIPFFSVGFFGAVYFRVDVFILSLMKTDAVVGWYGAAYRLFETTNFIPEAFLFAMFPVLCRLSARDDKSLVLATQKSVDLLMLAGVPIAVGTGVLAPRIISTLYGPTQYENSVIVLRILAAAIALMYVNGAFVQLLVATERQHKLAITAGTAAILNVTLNLVLIPRFGAAGAAVSTVLTECTVLSINFAFLPRALTRQLQFGAALKSLLSAGIMAVPLVLLGGASLALSVPAGIVTYLLAAAALRLISAEDLALMKAAILGLRAA